MATIISLAKRTLLIIAIVIYMGGICNEFVIWSSHTFFHYITHTLSHHEHLHDHNHPHDHEHSRLIDFALHEIDNETENHSQPEAAVIKTELKFTDHLTKYITGIPTICDLPSVQNTPYHFSLKIGFSRLITPPPKTS